MNQIYGLFPSVIYKPGQVEVEDAGYQATTAQNRLQVFVAHSGPVMAVMKV